MNLRPTRAFVLAAALLLAGEFVVRVGFARNMDGRFDYGFGGDSGFDEKSDGTVELFRSGGRRFLPQTFRLAKPAGVYRIMVVGDSVPRGSSLEQAYPWKLADALRTRGIPAECINLGVAGFGARRSQLILRHCLRYHPDLVILHLNNSNEFEDERDWQRMLAAHDWHPRNWATKSVLVARLHEMKTEQVFWSLLPPGIRNQGAVDDGGDESVASLVPENIRRWNEQVASTTLGDASLVREAGAAFMIVTQARCEADAAGNRHLDDHGLDAIARTIQGDRVARLSMREALGDGDFKRLFADGSHLKPEGHERLARAIAARIVESGIGK